jgi:hypothetical protein
VHLSRQTAKGKRLSSRATGHAHTLARVRARTFAARSKSNSRWTAATISSATDWIRSHSTFCMCLRLTSSARRSSSFFRSHLGISSGRATGWKQRVVDQH